jgi:hypothetical protein
VNPADACAAAYRAGRPLTVAADGELVVDTALPREVIDSARAHRATLAPLLSLPVAVLTEGMTDDEREAFEERAGLLEYEGQLPRDLAERLAAWWVRTPICERGEPYEPHQRPPTPPDGSTEVPGHGRALQGDVARPTPTARDASEAGAR